MKIFRIKLRAISNTLTPFQADTIFGHLCWIVAYNEGEIGLQEFLQPFREGNPLFIISEGFPDDFLPKPLSAEFNVDNPSERKELKKIDLIPWEDFNSVSKGEKIRPKLIEIPIKKAVTPHNTINRLLNSTLKEGGVYSVEETFIPNITIYIKVISEDWKTRIIGLLDDLSKSGYGRRKSIGKGQFSVISVERFEGFDDSEDANGFVTLSSFCPEESDPTEGFYKTFVKYGKLGEEFTFCGNPFKKPLVMITPGSVFKTNGPPKEFYGRMIEKISPAKPKEVVQYGYAFAVPMRFR